MQVSAGAAPGDDAPLPEDIFTEPGGAADTLAHLGPLRAFAGTWEGRGVDIHPVSPAEGGSAKEPFDERIVLEHIDRNTLRQVAPAVPNPLAAPPITA